MKIHLICLCGSQISLSGEEYSIRSLATDWRQLHDKCVINTLPIQLLPEEDKE
jgi:hypothetical protein